MASESDIANFALSHLGIGEEIANLDNEKTQEAVACRRFYTEARDATLKDFPWPFATKLGTLALVAANPSETDEWDYSYRYPIDALILRRIPTGIRTDTHQSRIRFKLGRDDQGLLIYTDQPEAKIEYTYRETNASRFPADFVLAFSYRLAVYVAPRLTGGDPFKLGNRAMQLYIQEISMAQASAASEEVPDAEPESEFIRAREDSGFLPPGQGGGTPFGL